MLNIMNGDLTLRSLCSNDSIVQLYQKNNNNRILKRIPVRDTIQDHFTSHTFKTRHMCRSLLDQHWLRIVFFNPSWEKE